MKIVHKLLLLLNESYYSGIKSKDCYKKKKENELCSSIDILHNKNKITEIKS